jgi:hypothetical protein
MGRHGQTKPEQRQIVSGAVAIQRKDKVWEVPDFIGGPGRTRTCNQTAMSGRIKVGFVEFATVLSVFDRVCRVLMSSFLMRNGCGGPII